MLMPFSHAHAVFSSKGEGMAILYLLEYLDDSTA